MSYAHTDHHIIHVYAQRQGSPRGNYHNLTSWAPPPSAHGYNLPLISSIAVAALAARHSVPAAGLASIIGLSAYTSSSEASCTVETWTVVSLLRSGRFTECHFRYYHYDRAIATSSRAHLTTISSVQQQPSFRQLELLVHQYYQRIIDSMLDWELVDLIIFTINLNH